MSKDSHELRADIAQTRDELRSDVDAIVDKVSPSHIAHRQTARIKDSVTKVKESVMGRSEDMSERTQHLAHDANEAVHEAPQKVAQQTRGNPLAAGLIAFGAGLLASSLIPGSRQEEEMVQRLKDKAEPLTTELTDAAKQVAEDMKEPVSAVVDDLRDTAQQSVDRVKSETVSESEHLQQEAKNSVQDYKDRA